VTLRRHYLVPALKQFARVTVATGLVAGAPMAVVFWLRSSGMVSSTVLCVLVGVGLSMCASQLGCVLWEKLPGSEDLLFSELMIWGYLVRLRTQRRLASAVATLGPMSEAGRGEVDGLSIGERAKLLERLVAGIETRDPYLHGHSRRVARHAWMIARRMGLSRVEVARIRTAAAIHDVGKVETPMAILHKPGRLTDEEYEVIKRHPGDGAQMAHALRDPELTSMVRHHHERLDGSGYPDGLSGEAIPLGARIIAVADTFDAITSKRAYRPASPHKRAIDILREEAGTTLDPTVVRAFCGHYAGRRPLALWAFLAGLPERIVSWLGGSAASVASAAKVVAVTALVGGAAVASSTLGLAVAKRHPTKTPMLPPRTHLASSASLKASVPLGVAATPGSGHAGRARHIAVTRAVGHAAPSSTAPAAQASLPGTAPRPSQNGGVVQESENPNGGGGSEGPRKGEGEAPVKSEEALGKAKEVVKEAPGKVEEVAGTGKGEEAPVKSGEVVGKSEEAQSKVEEVAKEAPGKVEEAAGQAKEALGKSK
jgi:hypothetical protein